MEEDRIFGGEGGWRGGPVQGVIEENKVKANKKRRVGTDKRVDTGPEECLEYQKS